MFFTKAIGICGLSLGAYGVSQPVLAQVSNVEPMTGYQQLGVCGFALGLVAVALTRTIPALAREQSAERKTVQESHNAAMREVADKHLAGLNGLSRQIEGLREDLNEHLEEQVRTLRGRWAGKEES